MPITSAQRLARRNHIGASDLPAIMGLDTFKTAADVWLEKRGMLIDSPEAAVEHLERFVFPATLKQIAEFDEDRRVREIIEGERAIQANMAVLRSSSKTLGVLLDTHA